MRSQSLTRISINSTHIINEFPLHRMVSFVQEKEEGKISREASQNGDKMSFYNICIFCVDEITSNVYALLVLSCNRFPTFKVTWDIFVSIIKDLDILAESC